METNVFLTTAYEISAEGRVPSAEHGIAAWFSRPSALIPRPYAVEIEGEAPLIAMTEAFDA